MISEDILDLVRKKLDQGLYFGKDHITRATDRELIDFAEALIAQEREACAKVCDERAEAAELDWLANNKTEFLYEYHEAEECAQAIRNRETP
jgi:hypothetical protein